MKCLKIPTPTRQHPAAHPSASAPALSKEHKPAAKPKPAWPSRYKYLKRRGLHTSSLHHIPDYSGQRRKALGIIDGERVQKFTHLSHAHVHVCSVIPSPVVSNTVYSMYLPLINTKTKKTDKTFQYQSKFPPLPLPAWGFINFGRPERHLLTHSNSPSSQALSEICPHDSTLRPVIGTTSIHKKHGCCTVPSEIEQNAYPKLSKLSRLIRVHSEDVLYSYTSKFLHHLQSLGLFVNLQKSMLQPSQTISFSGIKMESLSMQARISRLHSCANQFSHCVQAGRSSPLSVSKRHWG